MMKKTIAIIACLLVSGCTTPSYVYKHPKTGQVERCGGDVTASLAGGAIGYHIQRSNDEKCRLLLEIQGFEEIEGD